MVVLWFSVLLGGFFASSSSFFNVASFAFLLFVVVVFNGVLFVGHQHAVVSETVAPIEYIPFRIDSTVVSPPFLEPLVEQSLFFRNVSQLNLFPTPREIHWGGGLVEVTGVPTVEWKVSSSNDGSKEYQDAAIQRFLKRFERLENSAPSVAFAGVSAPAVSMHIRVLCNGTYVPHPLVVEDEHYELSHGRDGAVDLHAATHQGALRGLATLAQMTLTHSHKKYFASDVQVKDRPYMSWRGLLLDVSRNFHPLEHILAVLDVMEFVKLNVFHFHLCDDQGWRMESKVHPKLHQVASGGEFYTQEDIKKIVREASLRGIRVVPEVDIPGHAGAILLAYPELAVRVPDPSYRPSPVGGGGVGGGVAKLKHEAVVVETPPPLSSRPSPAIEGGVARADRARLRSSQSRKLLTLEDSVQQQQPPLRDVSSNATPTPPPIPMVHLSPKELPQKWGQLPWVLDATSETVYAWIERMLEEVVQLFPDPFFHIGGDEVPSGAWSDTLTQNWMHAHGMHGNHELQLHFNQRVYNMLHKHNRTLVGWDEILTPSLPKDVVVQLWRSWVGGLAQEADKLRLRSITSEEMYLDWARPVKHYHKQDMTGGGGYRDRVGAEACMWSEWVQNNLDTRLWPTLAVIAEQMWRPNPKETTATMYGRLFGISRALARVGSTHEAAYDLSLAAVRTGKPYSFAQLLQWSEPANDPVSILIRRAANSMQPINRVGGENKSFKHDLVELIDALRPDSLEMRAFEMLLDSVVDQDKFTDPQRVGLVVAYLKQYADLEENFKSAQLYGQIPGLKAAKKVIGDISKVAALGVELIEARAAGTSSRVRNAVQNLLQTVARVEDTILDGDKVIIELAHVLETRLAKKFN